MKTAFLRISILAVLSAVIGCASGEDYDPPSEQGECPASYWNDHWSSPQFISFFDDSLAIYKTLRYKTEYLKEYFFLEGNKCVPYATDRHTGLWLANYRTKLKPMLVDTLDYNIGIVLDYFKDSSLFVIKDKRIEYNKFGFWKIGRSSVQFQEMEAPPESVFYFYNGSFDRAMPWIDDNILIKDRAYGVLNTKTGNVEKLDLLEQDDWMAACEDMSYINGKILCLRPNREEHLYELVVDNVVANVTDTSSLYLKAYFCGNYVAFYGGQLRRVFKINSENFKFDETFNVDNHIEYSEKDFE